MDTEKFHFIDTRMYGGIAYYILEKACDTVEYYLFSKPHREKDGTTYLQIFKGKNVEFAHPKEVFKNPFFGKDDAEVMSMIADKLKSFADRFAEDESLNGNWWNGRNRIKWTCARDSNCNSVKLLMSDLYKTYMVLKGKTHRFDRRIVGKKLTDADLKRIERAKAKAKAKADAKFKKDYAEWQKTRTISTCMYGDIAYEFLSLLCGHYYFRLLPKNMRELETFVKVIRAENKRICLKVKCRKFNIESDKRCNPFFGKSNAEACIWLGNAIKLFAIRYAEDKLGHKIEKKHQNISNHNVVFGPADYSWLSSDIRVSDAYAIADALKGVKLENEQLNEQIVGKPLSKEDIKKLNEAKAKEKAVQQLQFDFMKKISKETCKIKKEFEEKLHKIDPKANMVGMNMKLNGCCFSIC